MAAAYSDVVLEPAPDLDAWERHLCTPVAGKRVIVAFELLTGMASTVTQLARWGAERPLLVADGRGTGPIPATDEADVLMLADQPFDSLTDQVRARMEAEAMLSADVVTAVDAYDPDGNAVWWVSPVGSNTALLGRDVLGGRPPEQAGLEDKLIVDELLDAVGAERGPAAAARATYEGLMSATQEVLAGSDGDQVVWSGDTRDGTNGGGDYVRWIRTNAQARDAADFFASRCDRVRVTEFLEGVPCSIHGICLPDGVVVLRPVELATLRDPVAGRFVHGGLGTSWDPPPADATEMRRVARAIGQHLQDTKGYRGAFGIDGVATAKGFRVTELNTRFSGGLTRLSRAAPEAHLDLVQVNALIGRDIAKPAAELEILALGLLEDNRFIDVRGLSSRHAVESEVSIAVRAGGRRLERADMSEPDVGSDTPAEVRAEVAAVVGSVTAGPSPLGTFIRLTAADGIVRVGERVAPYSVLLHEFADRMWDTGFGSVLMPPDVTRRTDRAGVVLPVASDG